MEQEFIKFEGSEEFKERVKSIVNDPISIILNDFLEKRYVKFEDISKLRVVFEKRDTIFNSYEVTWIINHHKIWFDLLEAPMGRNIFLEFYRYSNNVYSLAKKLETTRITVYKWTGRLLKCDWLFINTAHYIGKNVKMLILNKEKYNNLMLLTRYFILNNIAKG